METFVNFLITTDPLRLMEAVEAKSEVSHDLRGGVGPIALLAEIFGLISCLILGKLLRY